MKKVLIAEEIPALNKGEAAILNGMLEIFGSIGEFRISLFSFHSTYDLKEYGNKVEIIDLLKCLHLPSNISDTPNRFMLFFIYASLMFYHLLFLGLYFLLGSRALYIMNSQIWRNYVDSDLIIVGHDSLITAYGYLPIVIFSKTIGKEVMILGGGVGRYGGWFWEMLAKPILNKIDLITLREEISYNYLIDIGITNPPMIVTADPGFLMRPVSPERSIELLDNEHIPYHKSPLIGITVSWISTSKYYLPEIKNIDEKHRAYVQLIAKVVDHITEELNINVVLLAHVFGPEISQDDRITLEAIYRQSRNKDMVWLITKEYTAEEIKGIIGNLDLLVGERLHSIIAAITMNVPIIAITYPSPRMLGIARMMHIEDWVVNVEELDSKLYISKIDQVWSVRDEVKQNLKMTLPLIESQALINGQLIMKYIFNGVE
jgi:polysaccharide pyruvyl transferase WcaK-like protein